MSAVLTQSSAIFIRSLQRRSGHARTTHRRGVRRETYDARKTRTHVRHIWMRHPGMTIADGYAIQRAWVRIELVDGRKIGLTSRAM